MMTVIDCECNLKICQRTMEFPLGEYTELTKDLGMDVFVLHPDCPITGRVIEVTDLYKLVQIGQGEQDAER